MNQNKTPKNRNTKPVVTYILILFSVAFLLMTFSFLAHQRSNTEVMGELKDSLSSLADVQSSQDIIMAQQTTIHDQEKELESLQEKLKDLESDKLQDSNILNAMNMLHQLEMQYQQSDYEACLNTMQFMEDTKLLPYLPDKTSDEVSSPAMRFEQIKEVVLNT